MMNLKVEIRRNVDNVIATYVECDWDYIDFWWSEGNAACDCNRHDFFNAALKMPATSIKCSSELYSVRLTDNDTMKCLYDEFS